MIMDNVICFYFLFFRTLFFIINELTALYPFTQHLMKMKMMYTCAGQSPHAIVACSVRSVGLKALTPAANGRCLVCKSQNTTLIFKCTVHKYIYPAVSKVHVGSFCVSVIHITPDMDWKDLQCAYVIILMCAYIYTHGYMHIHHHHCQRTHLRTQCSDKER